MLEIKLEGRYGPMTLTMTGRLEDVCAIHIIGDPVDEADLRNYLENEARGLFGHYIADGRAARPSDVMAGLFSRPDVEARWHPQLIRRPPGVVDPHLPPGAVT